ncbi:MAG: hypothetical protein ACRCTA_05700 [Bacilli bacterium]
MKKRSLDIVKIIKIKPKQGLYQIILNNKETLLCNEDDILAYKLYIDNQIDLDTFTFLKEKTIYNLCFVDLIKLVNYKFYSTYKLKQKLLIKKYDTVIVDKVIKQALNKGLVNDDMFIESYLNQKKELGYGPLYIKQKLKAQGLIFNEGYTYEEEYENLLKHFNRANDGSYDQLVFKVKFKHQMRLKGYHNDTIEDVLNQSNIISNDLKIREDFTKALRKYQSHANNQYQYYNKVKMYLYRLGYSIHKIDELIKEYQDEQN